MVGHTYQEIDRGRPFTLLALAYVVHRHIGPHRKRSLAKASFGSEAFDMCAKLRAEQELLPLDFSLIGDSRWTLQRDAPRSGHNGFQVWHRRRLQHLHYRRDLAQLLRTLLPPVTERVAVSPTRKNRGRFAEMDRMPMT